MVTVPSNAIHLIMTRQTAQRNQVPEFLTGCILKPHNPPSHHCQNLSAQISQNHNIPMVEQTPRNQNSDRNNCISPQCYAIARIATQRGPHAATTSIHEHNNFDGKSNTFQLFEDLFHAMVKLQPEITEAMKTNHFHARLQKGALQPFKDISASNKKTLDDVLIVFRRKYVKPESQATAKQKWHKLKFDSNTKSLSDFPEELNEC